MKRTGFQFILGLRRRWRQSRKCIVWWLPLPHEGIQRHRCIPGFSGRLHFADKLVSRHVDIFGRKRPNVKRRLSLGRPSLRLRWHRQDQISLPAMRQPSVGLRGCGVHLRMARTEKLCCDQKDAARLPIAVVVLFPVNNRIETLRPVVSGASPSAHSHCAGSACPCSRGRKRRCCCARSSAATADNREPRHWSWWPI